MTKDEHDKETTGDRLVPLTKDEIVYASHYNVSGLDIANNPPGEERLASLIVHDVNTNETKVINRLENGGTLPYDKYTPLSFDVSHDARYLVAVSVEETFGIAEPSQIVLMDTETRQFEAISVNTAGEHANGQCSMPKISADGRYVAFLSNATNLIPGVSDGGQHRVFIYDRIEGSLDVVPAPEDYPQDESTFSTYSFDMTPDGRYVVYGQYNDFIYRYDRETGESDLVLTPLGEHLVGYVADIHVSDDANVIAFTTDGDLSPLDDNFTNSARYFINALDVYVAILEPESLVADWECY